jgi:hypothetical protein
MTEPTPGEFGLSEEEAKRRERLPHWPPGENFSLCGAAAGALIGALKWGAGGAIAGVFIGSLGGLVACGVLPSLREALDPAAKKYQLFDEARTAYREAWLRTQLEFWLSLTGSEFEREVSRVLKERGYAAERVGRKGDGGVDIIAFHGGRQIIVQCKAWRRDIGPAVVRELYGTLMASSADAAILATTSRLTSAASSFLEGKQIQVWTLENLLQG